MAKMGARAFPSFRIRDTMSMHLTIYVLSSLDIKHSTDPAYDIVSRITDICNRRLVVNMVTSRTARFKSLEISSTYCC